jgi:NAD(P)H-dependent flavin oxidoreductase YrpB (nitropropane dioxygenase family)
MDAVKAARAFASRLGISKSIFQAPIGSVASVDLAAAVSNAGGAGSLALTWTPPEEAASLILALKRRTVAPFFVNFVLSFESRALLPALEAGAPIVTFSWGLPGALVRQVHTFGALAGVQVASASGARRAIEEGCDFLICQGIEAGGHVQSSTPLKDLLAAVLDASGTIPVVAAGGLADGRDIAAVINAGASGVMLGTRFVAANESRAHPQYKQALVEASASDTVLTGCFDGGWPSALHRVLRGSTFDAWEMQGCPLPARRPGEGDIVARMPNGAEVKRYDDTPPTEDMQGDVMACCLYAGTGVERIRAVQPAAELVATLWQEAIGYCSRSS